MISSDPPAGRRVRAATAVTLTVSRGPRPIKVPDWTGRDATRATQVFTKKGFTVNRSESYDDSVPEGRVISQTPSSGTLFRGDQVRLVVSLGPELVEVPRGLVGSGVDAAEEKLRGLGFDVDIQQSDSYIGLQFVLRVEPGSGELVPKGSTITLYLV